VASLFTGLWPQVHGANDDPDTLSEEATTLAESLKELGYTTAAITANGNAHGPWGFDQGFDYFKYLSHVRPDDPLANSDDVNKAVVAWLEEHSQNQPFFLFVHTIDAVMLEQRAASFSRRSIKTDAKRLGLRLALSMVDLTTLEGRDSPEKVRSLCRQAIRPHPVSIDPPLPSWSASSLPPTMSAPASSASLIFSAPAKTAMRIDLPVPCGRLTVPRTS